MLVGDGRKGDFVPARAAPAMLGSMRVTNVSKGVPVAAKALAIDSVEGQRARPCGVTRFDLLKVVASSPARLASPEGDRPARAARRSMADQTCAWVSIRSPQLPRDGRELFLPPQVRVHACFVRGWLCSWTAVDWRASSVVRAIRRR